MSKKLYKANFTIDIDFYVTVNDTETIDKVLENVIEEVIDDNRTNCLRSSYWEVDIKKDMKGKEQAFVYNDECYVYELIEEIQEDS